MLIYFHLIGNKVYSSLTVDFKQHEGGTRDVRTVLFWVILVKDQAELVKNPYSR